MPLGWISSQPKAGTGTGSGPAGKSAYELAVAAGYSGTLTEWLDSLKGAASTVPGPKGDKGDPGTAGTKGDAGTAGAAGAAGKSAYELAVAAGYSGTQAQWLASLKVPADSLRATAGNGVLTALRHGRSVTLQLVGDSTGDASDEWAGLLGVKLGDAWDANVLWRGWSDTTKGVGAPTVLRTSSQGERHVSFTAGQAQLYGAPAITRDLEIVAKLAPSAWTGNTVNQIVCARWHLKAADNVTDVNSRSFILRLSSSGKLQLQFSGDGTASSTVTSAVVVPFTGSQIGWVKVTLAFPGGNGYTVNFATSTDGQTWTALGASVNGSATVAGLFDPGATLPYQLGSNGLIGNPNEPFSGKIYWVELRPGADKSSVVPPLPEDWEWNSNYYVGTVQAGGAPNVVVVGTSTSGKNIDYFGDSANTGMYGTWGQHLLLFSDGHNEVRLEGRWQDKLSAFLGTYRATAPGAPLVVVTQNPVTAPPLTEWQRQVRASRGVRLATWAASQGGVYAIDTYPAFTTLASDLGGDGLHPNAQGEGKWAQYVYDRLFA